MRFLSPLKERREKRPILGVLLEGYWVSNIGLFGSYVRNEATEDSDIDLLVDLKQEKKTFRNFMSLCYFREDLFGRKVELVTLQSLSPYIGPHILKTVEYATQPL